eukprot:comp20553_c0_seq1/m.26386 comp20553_c0_seq1/g.26386  ORF comp20553_c0_seq1/g.26386 comp20553_c0_seq1/m.26386 type:complete len:239 (-) comp20553_c0_seq1:479-1195(-)
MARIQIIPTALCFVGFVLLLVGVATSNWMRISETAMQSFKDTNSTLQHLGLFQACYISDINGGTDCTSINWYCDAMACWYYESGVYRCVSANIWPLGNCAAFQSTRVLAVITLFVSVAAVGYFVAITITRDPSKFGFVASSIALAAGLVGMIAMSVWVGAVFNQTSENKSVSRFFNLHWSFSLFVSGWVIILCSGIVGAVLAFRLKQGYTGDEDGEMKDKITGKEPAPAQEPEQYEMR